MKVEGLIRDVDLPVYKHLETPSGKAPPQGDPIKDKDVNRRVRSVLLDAFMSTTRNAIAEKVAKYYQDGQFELEANIRRYNDFLNENFLDEYEDFEVNRGTLWGGTSTEQRVGFGMFMISIGALTNSDWSR